jgi:hypothetical protein
VTADNIVRQLNLSGKTWKSYAESLPSVGYTGPDQYPYVKRHNPFAYFSDVLGSQAQANKIVPFSQFPIDLANNQLPHYSFIIPNQLNNAHDCPPSNPSCTNTDKIPTADQWLKTNIDPLIANPAFQNSLLVIVFDESVNADTQNGGGHVAMVVVSPKAKQAYQTTTVYQHQNTLRLTAEALGTGYPGASATASNMAEFFSATPNTAPIATSVSPNSGPVAGGTVVSITGTGFTNGATVTFGGTAASAVNVVGSTTITATTPAHASGQVNVVVRNPNTQSSTLPNAFTYAAAPAPTVSTVSPTSGTAAGGTPVTISGTNYVSGATVTFGGTTATGVIVNSSSSISATTPAHAAGAVNVVVTNPDSQSGTLTNGFTYNPIPGGETVLLADDFNDASLNTSLWIANNLFSGFTDPSVATVETQRLEIGPLKQNVDGSHYNGIRSASAYNFTGAYAYVQLVQPPSANTAADAFYTIGLNADNCYRMYVEAGNLIVQRKVGGAKQTLASITFNATNHAFWRMRHDALSGQVIFETAPSNAGTPGAWTQVFSEPWNTSAIPLSAVSFELKGGTWRLEASAPGTVAFDNFRAAKP